MKKYLKHVGADASASIVVLLVALPLCLGIALGSGAPLFSGIIAGVVGGIVIGTLSGSQLSVSGPAAGLTVIVATAITKLQVYEAFLLAVVIGGLLQVILGFLKAGVIGDYVPNAVIKGMLAAIGLILILKQFPHLIGYDTDFEGDESFIQANDQNTFTAMFEAVKYITPTALVIGLVSILLLMFWESKFIKTKKSLKLFPGALIVVLVGTILNEYLRLSGSSYALEQKHLVTLPVAESVGSFLSFFTFPDIQFLKNPDVWMSGITLAIVASLETLLGIEAADKLDPLKRVTPTNRELKAQGIGNMVSGMIGGLPLTSVVVRTSANISAGAKSKMSTILHGSMMLLCVMFVPTILNKIPLCALAAVLIFTGYKLAKVSLFKEFYIKGWNQFVPFVATIAAILLTDLLIGILVGICVALFFLIRSNFRSAVMVVNDDNNYLIRFRKDVSFLNKPIVKKKLEEVPKNAFVIIDAERADFIDKDVIEEVNNFLCHAHLKKIRVEVKTGQNKSTKNIFTIPQITEE